ncbi:hypothetical protein [Sphingosinicella sp. CPCC 101087]|uniref:hypothetical protein n=1 Tax=Sphingosinicella sp. CPCC 101087 TaxID=2497754 RepID=UPI00101CE75B|nr:hypothetical protein [Sphingosinicella sp. CPCC 101087]
MSSYRFQRGETIALALDAIEGDPDEVVAITAEMRKVGAPTISAAFTVAPRAAASDVPAGWNLTVSADASEQLPEGIYRADARLELAAGIVITDPVRVRIVGR